jgi:hypothetical protein
MSVHIETTEQTVASESMASKRLHGNYATKLDYFESRAVSPELAVLCILLLVLSCCSLVASLYMLNVPSGRRRKSNPAGHLA